MGELDAWTRLTVVRKLCGHDAIGPSRVFDQSMPLIAFAIAPPPTSQSSGRGSLRACVPTVATDSMIIKPPPLRTACPSPSTDSVPSGFRPARPEEDQDS